MLRQKKIEQYLTAVSSIPCSLDDQNEGKINLTDFLQQVATLPESIDFDLNYWKAFFRSCSIV